MHPPCCTRVNQRCRGGACPRPVAGDRKEPALPVRAGRPGNVVKGRPYIILKTPGLRTPAGSQRAFRPRMMSKASGR